MKTQMLSSQSLFEDGMANATNGEGGAGTNPGNGGGARDGSQCDGDYCPPAPKPPTPEPPVTQPPVVVQPPVVKPPVVKPPVTQEPQAPVDLPPMPVPVKKVCTTDNAFPRKHDSRVMNSDELYVRVYSSATRAGGALCESHDTQGKYREQIKKGSLDLSDCLEKMSASQLDSMTNQTLYVAVDATSASSRNLEYRSGKGAAAMTLSKSSSGAYTAAMGTLAASDDLWLAFDVHPKDVAASESGQHATALCDDLASPLVIDLRGMEGAEDASFSLTSMERGVLFDILGANAEPVPHTPMRISWFHRHSGVGILTLPNAQGEVNGIDELFGDNTRGPDGLFATNGYKALAKYDDNGDGLITQEDAVFSKLRVWMDRDADGVAARHELISLKQARISVLDLNYDGNYREKDRHGNMITYKSVVKFENGAYRLMFDIWFKTKK
ncbi:MAG: hypothetical protein KF802_01140 [Bdellovibrionaceae bacterium]|nr:hypothetical protein [Pseudobdellovibrionaceae bacterium]